MHKLPPFYCVCVQYGAARPWANGSHPFANTHRMNKYRQLVQRSNRQPGGRDKRGEISQSRRHTVFKATINTRYRLTSLLEYPNTRLRVVRLRFTQSLAVFTVNNSAVISRCCSILQVKLNPWMQLSLESVSRRAADSFSFMLSFLSLKSALRI